MGYSQAARQLVLVQSFGGSNPPTPSNRECCFKIHLRFLYRRVEQW